LHDQIAFDYDLFVQQIAAFPLSEDEKRNAAFSKIAEFKEWSQRCLNHEIFPSVAPVQQAYGWSLGPVGRMSGWLITTRSLDVVMIVGLVGFGLLGALLSKFVTSDFKAVESEGGPEFFVVVLSGFVAALIVFVGAFAGLVVFSEEGGGRPNTYAVSLLA
jgi:hypothetical protein